MTPTACRATAAALLALAATLTSCSNPAEPASLAPSTWAVPTDTAALPAKPTTTVPQPTAAPADDPTSDTTRPLATDPARATEIPTASAEIPNPTYDINNIDRTDPAQVAWAYLSHRLSQSYTDPAPGAGLTAAAQYATPELAGQLAVAAAGTQTGLQELQESVIATPTHLTTYSTRGRTTVIATWTLTVANGTESPRASSGISTTLSLITNAGSWLVAADGLSRPD